MIIKLKKNKTISIYQSLLKAGVTGFNSPCGGCGICGKCRIKLLSGKIDGELSEDNTFLACKCKAATDIEIELSETAFHSS